MAKDRSFTRTGVTTTGYYIPRGEGTPTAGDSTVGTNGLMQYLSGFNFTETAGAAAVVKIRDTLTLPGKIASAADGAAGNSTAGLHMYMITWVTANGESTFGRNTGDRLEHTTAGSKIVGLTGIPVAPVNPDGYHSSIASGILGRRVYATKAGAPATGITPTTAQWFLTVADGSSTIAAGSNNFTLPQGTISVASGAAFANVAGSKVLIATTNGPQIVTYTAVSSNDLTGCTGGSGLMVTGQAVTQPMIPNNTATTFNVNLADGSFTATTPPVQDTAGRRIVEIKLASGQTVGEHWGDNVMSSENGGGFAVEVVSGTVDWEIRGQ